MREGRGQRAGGRRDKEGRRSGAEGRRNRPSNQNYNSSIKAKTVSFAFLLHFPFCPLPPALCLN
jgi:hypothetical protein